MELYQQLEIEWAEWNELDPAHVVACSSGTAALHLACEAVPLDPSRSIATPTYNMVACGRAISAARRVITMLDVGSDGLLPEFGPWRVDFRAERPSAILLTHIYGREAPLKGVHEVCRETGAYVIEDLAEAHGILPHRSSFAACWSFYRNKIVAGEEGGAVWFRELAAAERARRMRSLGFTADHDYWHEPYGMNYRLSNAHAGLILQSLKDYDFNVSRRWELLSEYRSQLPTAWLPPLPKAPWVCDVCIPGMTHEEQAKVVKSLNSEGIAARQGFKPLHQQLEWRDQWKQRSFPVAERLSSEVIYLPLDPKLTESEVHQAVQKLRQAVGDLP